MKSECSEHQKNIARLFLGDLDPAERQSLEDHLSTCALCSSEKMSYAQTLDLLQSSADEPVPRHFFIHPEERESNPWQLFRQMRPRWQVVTAAFAGLFLLMLIAAASRLQIRSDPGGWVMSFNRSDVDVAAFKRDILKTAEERNRDANAVWLQEVRAEIARSRTELTGQQQANLAAALIRLDSRLTGRVTQADDRLRTETQRLAAYIYQTVAQQRAEDLNIINTRFDTIEAANVVETRQTNNILDTLLQVAELRLR